jgi:prevent-host-death family protein
LSDTQFARTFSATELANKSGDVMLAAERAPVAVLKHGTPRYVVLTVDAYEMLVKARGDSRRSYRVKDMPPEMADAILTEIRRASAEEEPDGAS